MLWEEWLDQVDVRNTCMETDKIKVSKLSLAKLMINSSRISKIMLDYA